jgi:hypothetical protein
MIVGSIAIVNLNWRGLAASLKRSTPAEPAQNVAK